MTDTQHTEEKHEFNATIRFEDIATPARSNYKADVENLMVAEPDPDPETPYREKEDQVPPEVVTKIVRRF
jgi:hypothetical protein